MNPIESPAYDLLLRRQLGEALSPDETAELERALAADPALRAEARVLHETLGALGRSVAARPPAALRDRVLASAAAHASAREAAPEIARAAPTEAARDRPRDDPRADRPIATRAAPRPRPRFSLPFALAAGIAVLATGVSVLMWRENVALRQAGEQQAAAARMLLEPNVVMSFTLRGDGAARDASALVLLDLDAKRASISAKRLPPLGEGRAYYLWAELDGQTVPCGRFQVLADGSVLTQFPIPVDSYVSPIRRLILTVEAGDDATAPRGPVVLSSA
jgi:hypothetical protein